MRHNKLYFLEILYCYSVVVFMFSQHVAVYFNKVRNSFLLSSFCKEEKELCKNSMKNCNKNEFTIFQFHSYNCQCNMQCGFKEFPVFFLYGNCSNRLYKQIKISNNHIKTQSIVKKGRQHNFISILPIKSPKNHTNRWWMR